MHYSLKKLPAEAKFIKIIFGNIGGTPWSPCIESIELKEHNTDEVGFADCVSTKYYNSTAKLKNLGLINGYSNSEFKPSGDITRAEFSAMMAKLLDLNSVYNPASLKQVFNDVTADYWGAGSIYALYSLGIVNGDENGNFNPELNIPNWVAWELNSSKLIERESRAGHFYPDPDIPRGIETGDYSNSGYDRGHMCPAADNKWDKQAMRESFYMTNICPQHHNLNRGDWKELEDDCRRWVEESGTIYIACGPILYKNDISYIGEERKIRVPNAFFKVILAGLDEGKPRAIGFIYKNTSGNNPLDHYVNSVDQVERITGLDFFSQLPDDVENEIESNYNLNQWR